MYYPPPTKQEDTTKIVSPPRPYPSVTRGKGSLQPWYRRRESIIKLGIVGGFLLLALIVYICVSTIAREGINQLSLNTPSIPSQAGTPGTAVEPTADGGTAQVSIPSLHATPKPKGSLPATSRPATTPTATPTPTPTGSQGLFVQFVSLYGAAFSPAKATVQTLPGAALTINVVYCSGNVQDSSHNLDGTVYADSNGNYTWHWTPRTSCKSGRAYVIAKYNGQKATTSGVFTLR